MKKFICLLILAFFTMSNAQTKSDTESMFSNSNIMDMITVTVGGDFIITGSFKSLQTERVDELVTRLFQESKQQALGSARDQETFVFISQQVDKFALRNILLKHDDGTEEFIDLMKFRLTAEFENNPYLKNGDVLIFPPLDLDRNFVEVQGAVNKPTKFQFVDGDKIEDALLFTQGLNKAYDHIEAIEISRLNLTGNEEEIIKLNPDETSFELKRGDRIKFVSEETNRKSFKVLVLGEVKSPGYVYISKSSTNLKSVIEKAGGFTENASVKEAEIIRDNENLDFLKLQAFNANQKEIVFGSILKEYKLRKQQVKLLAFQRMATYTEEDSIYFKIDNLLRLQDNVILKDFTGLENNQVGVSDVVVADNDFIIIPKIENRVYVFGQVAKVGYQKFNDELKFTDYINTAGGFGEYAEDDEVILIKSGTLEWINISDSENYKIESGDYIYIPKDPPRSFGYYLGYVGSVFGLLGSIATIALLIDNLSK